MSPAFTFSLTLVGVVAAGLPLIWLTGNSPRPAAAVQVETPQEQRTVIVPATIRFTGEPVSIRIRHKGEELACMQTAEISPWMPDLTLPEDDKELELEVEAVWPEGTVTEQALSVTLEPDGLPAAEQTHWSTGGTNTLHSLYTFTMP